jgi:hypothetical protein
VEYRLQYAVYLLVLFEKQVCQLVLIAFDVLLGGDIKNRRLLILVGDDIYSVLNLTYSGLALGVKLHDRLDT